MLNIGNYAWLCFIFYFINPIGNGFFSYIKIGNWISSIIHTYIHASSTGICKSAQCFNNTIVKARFEFYMLVLFIQLIFLLQFINFYFSFLVSIINVQAVCYLP